uniref:Integrase catalytic domain-containing protein n=1 Tax=Cannabis sativa TaxID=3483 RepID=A0A803PST9_CANSA
METQTRRKVKRFKIDNGLEFYSDIFTQFCTKIGIARHKTVFKNPQQNGLSKRFSRTILERVRCMLLSVNLSKIFWVEAVVTAMYLINRCPFTAIGMKTLEEVWFEHPLDLSRLRVFSYLAYAHIRKNKLEPRALKCMILGYLEGVKGYRLWCLEPRHKKCLISRDVVFNEVKMAYKERTNLTDSEPAQTAAFEPDELNFEVEFDDKPQADHDDDEP